MKIYSNPLLIAITLENAEHHQGFPYTLSQQIPSVYVSEPRLIESLRFGKRGELVNNSWWGAYIWGRVNTAE